MDSCVFAVHNFLKDRSFGKPDFICCCTVPIYMEPHLQKKALTTLHYALNKNLFLLPGKCETISSVSELFELTYKGDKIFSLKDVPAK